jgi:hypothetical protein
VGEGIWLRNAQFRIPATVQGEALAALKKAERPLGLGEPPDLVEALRRAGWEPTVDEGSGDVVGIDVGSGKVARSERDDVLFEELAPFVEDGGFIEMESAEGDLWRWVFEKGLLITEIGHIVWEEEAP